jgi:hypothetical protein
MAMLVAAAVGERIDAIPTRLSLKAEQVDAAIEGARAGTLALPRLREYLRERVNHPAISTVTG